MVDVEQVPDWKQYEWLITKIMHDEYNSWNAKVINDIRITGEYSEVKRQIDILVERNNERTIIECKHYSTPIDVKAIESFMSMMNDVNATYGIIISSSGFTTTVPKRIREYGDRIKLEKIDWVKAYESSFEMVTYGSMGDICTNCSNMYEIGKEVPGLLCWGAPIGAFDINDKVSLGMVARCLKCSDYTVYCFSCGRTTIYKKDDPCCVLRDIFVEYEKNDNS